MGISSQGEAVGHNPLFRKRNAAERAGIAGMEGHKVTRYHGREIFRSDTEEFKFQEMRMRW